MNRNLGTYTPSADPVGEASETLTSVLTDLREARDQVCRGGLADRVAAMLERLGEELSEAARMLRAVSG